MMNFSWSKEKVKNLILLVEHLPVLWNIASNEYKDKEKKQAALECLAEKFGTTAAEINRKIHNLRTQLNNEVRKTRRMKNEHGKNESYISTWEHFTTLQFMLPCTKTYAPRHVMGTPSTSTTDSKPKRIATAIKPKTGKLKKRPPVNDVLEKALKMMTESDDDAAIFGAFVASSLRNLRSDNYKRKLKRLVQHVILEIEEQEERELSFYA